MSSVDNYIHPAKTFNHISGDDGMLDIDAFLKKRLPSLLKDFRALHRRLASLSEASATYYHSRLEDTLRKIEETHTALERFDASMHSILDAAFERMEEKYASLPDLPSFPDIDLLPTLDDALASLEQKYSELESLDLADALDQTAQRFADALEEVDARLVSTRDLVQARLESLKAQHIAPILSRAQGLRRRAMSTAQQTLSSAQQTLESTSTELADAFQRALAAGASRLLHYHELPHEWQENPYIHSGYRFLATPRECMRSIVAVHNETGNIWTHLLGFIVFAALGYLELATQWGNLRALPLLDRVVFGIFFVAACKCLACSTIWHTFAQIAHLETMKSMACVDYVGISVLICASVMVFEYYGFYASSWPRAIYLTSTGILAIVGIFVPFSAWFDKREYRFLRTVFFLALGISAVVPIVHLVFLHGLNTVLLWLSPLLSSVICYLTGVFLYVNHYPEKIFPGWFDHVGNSHQLWHMCVVAGIWFHYRAGIRFVASPGVIGFPSVNTVEFSSL